ncbi:hypothetical protein ACIO3O_07660 [Streptomyces sp. NPDC087440]
METNTEKQAEGLGVRAKVWRAVLVLAVVAALVWAVAMPSVTAVFAP